MLKKFKIIFSLFHVNSKLSKHISKIRVSLFIFEFTSIHKDVKFFSLLQCKLNLLIRRIDKLMLFLKLKINQAKNEANELFLFVKPKINWVKEKVKITMIILVKIIFIFLIYIKSRVSLIIITLLLTSVLKSLFFYSYDYVLFLNDICLKFIVFLEIKRTYPTYVVLLNVLGVKAFILYLSLYFLAISSELFDKRNFRLFLSLHVDDVVLCLFFHLGRCLIGFTTLWISYKMFCYGYYYYLPYNRGFEDLHALIVLLILVLLFFIAGVCYILYEEFYKKK